MGDRATSAEEGVAIGSPSSPLSFEALDEDAQMIILSLLEPLSLFCFSLTSSYHHKNCNKIIALNKKNASNSGVPIEEVDPLVICATHGFAELAEFLVSDIGVSLEWLHLTTVLHNAPHSSLRKFVEFFLGYIEKHQKDIGAPLTSWASEIAAIALRFGDLSLIETILNSSSSLLSLFSFISSISFSVSSPRPIEVIEFIRKRVDSPQREIDLMKGVFEGILKIDSLSLWSHYYGQVISKEEAFGLFLKAFGSITKYRGGKILRSILEVQIPEILSLNNENGLTLLQKSIAGGDFGSFSLLVEKLDQKGQELSARGLSLITCFFDMEVEEVMNFLQARGYIVRRSVDAVQRSVDAEQYQDALFPYVKFPGFMGHELRAPVISTSASIAARFLDRYIAPDIYGILDMHEFYLLSIMTNDLALLDFFETKAVFSWERDRKQFLEALVKAAAAPAISDDIFPKLLRDLKKRIPSCFLDNVRVPNEGFGIYNAGFGKHSLLVHLLNVNTHKGEYIYELLHIIDLPVQQWKHILREAQVLGQASDRIYLVESTLRHCSQEFKRRKFAELFRLLFITYGENDSNERWKEEIYERIRIRTPGDSSHLIAQMRKALKE